MKNLVFHNQTLASVPWTYYFWSLLWSVNGNSILPIYLLPKIPIQPINISYYSYLQNTLRIWLLLPAWFKQLSFLFLDNCSVLLPGFAVFAFAPSSKHYDCLMKLGFFPSWEDYIFWGFWLVLGNGVWVEAKVPCGPSSSLSPCQWRC